MKKYHHSISLLIILGIIYWSFYALMPQKYSKENTALDKFATERALVHVRAMSKNPHYSGSSYHEEVQKYIKERFEALGLYVEIQKEYIIDQWTTLSKPENILTRIKGTGNGEALLLLAHYDAVAHSSLGASDDASGVATIIEGVRAFIASDVKPKNDIIILISDAEELGLSGAELFVKKHPWAKDVKLVINFEARGSGGPSHMFIEANGGNANMVRAFKKADVPFPVANSLAYTIYKMIPNDTDLTVFRKDADINGFNFAFIDDYFDYHTARDRYKNLDKNTLEHQGSYLMPLLHYFAFSDLNEIKSMEDDIYFSTPLGVHNYPYMWIFPLLVIAFLIFGFLLYLGFKRQRLSLKHILLGCLPFIIATALGAVAAHYGWKLLLNLYPQYKEIMQGFTYNGYLYIAAFVVFTLMLCFLCYAFFKTREHVPSYTVAPIFIGLIINVFIALYFKGASFFIIPIYFSLLLFYLIINHQKPNIIVLTLIALPIIVILVPFVQVFPVGLGLKMIFISSLCTGLIFGLLLPILGAYRFKKTLAFMLFIAFGIFVVKAHFNSNFSETRQKPNSLLYILDADKGTAYWATHDAILDDWTTRTLGASPKAYPKGGERVLLSGYGRGFTYVKDAPVKRILAPKIEITKDTVINNLRHLEVCISPQRQANKIEISVNDITAIRSLKANGQTRDISAYKRKELFSEQYLIDYFISDDAYLELQLSIPKQKNITLGINEISFDLLNHPLFTISQRSKDMIPKPFIINDAIVVKKKIKF